MFQEVSTEELERVCRKKEKIQALVQLIHYWRNGGDSFTCQLFSLFMKANHVNKSRLIKAFPEEAIIWLDWYSSPSEEAFF